MAHHYALTGNIGSGKTTVARQFERIGVPVYYADTAAKALMLQPPLRRALTDRFGSATYFPDGSLNRSHLATSFSDPAALADLNAIVHPAVHTDAIRWQREHANTAYTLYEAAIVLELGHGPQFSGVIVVHAPEAERRARVMLRDGVTAQQFDDRAARQWPDARKLVAADHVIQNTGSDLLLPQILSLHQLFHRGGGSDLP